MKKNFEAAGRWWNDRGIELIKKEGKTYALYGWNGEIYGDCWDVLEDGLTAGEKKFTIREIYCEIDEEEFEIVDYEINEI